MEKINTEILVSSLFTIGFDKVDPLLYTYTLGQLSIDNQKLQLFEFEDSETSQKFNDYVNYDGIIFKLKDGGYIRNKCESCRKSCLAFRKSSTY